MQVTPSLNGWLTDFGHGLGQAARGILDVGGKALQSVVTRGGADSDLVVNQDQAPQSQLEQYAIPAALAGVAVIGVVLLMNKKRRKVRRRR